MITVDWKKQAAQVLDEKEVERAFMDQAYNFIANKAGPLMQDPHRLGFEVVYSDEDHTRMVGMFAFRVNQELYSAPVFFLNGQIRGTDLLYSHSKKMFRPLNKDWATYTVEKQKNQIGQGISKGISRKMPMDLELDDIASPPGSFAYKSAAQEINTAELFTKLANSFAVSNDSSVRALILKYLDKKHTTDNPKPEDASCKEVKDKREQECPCPEDDEITGGGNVKKSSLLRKFLVEDGGLSAMEKLAGWMQDKRFAELLVSNVKPEDYMPEDLLHVEKSASANRPDLVLYTGGFEAFSQIPIRDMEKSAAAQEEFFQKGYYLWDDRAPGKLNPATKDMTIEMCKPGEPGLYKVLMFDGSMSEAYLAAPSQQNFSESPQRAQFATHPYAWDCTQWCKDQPRELVAVLKDSGETGTMRRIHGEFVKTLSDCIRDNELATTMTPGNIYRVFDAEAGVFSEPIYCAKKKEDNGLTIYTAACCGHYSKEFELKQNPDQDNTSFSANFLGRHVFFIPVAKGEGAISSDYDSYDKTMRHRVHTKSLPAVGDDQTLTGWILQTGVKEATLLRDEKDSGLFSLRAGPRKQTRYMKRASMAALCAQKLGIHARHAEYFLDQAAAEGSTRFFIGEPGVIKYAAPIEVVDEEYFNEDYDPQFNIGLDYPQAFELSTDTEGLEPPERRIGDAYDPGMGMTSEDGSGLASHVILGAPVDQLENLKAQAGVPNVFEHGLIGSLVHTYDSASMVEKYLPDMEAALDRLGRLLFLYYWKPRDFEDAYGADDMANLENKLLSTFQSFGELVLELTKKGQRRSGMQGNVAMFSA